MPDAVAKKWDVLVRLALACTLIFLVQSCSGDPATEPGKGSTTAPAKPQVVENTGTSSNDGKKSPPDNEDSHPEENKTIEQTLAGMAGSERKGEDWAEFLGPRGTGVSGETGLLEKWPEAGPPVAWKKKIGEGYSAPSVRGNRLVLFHRPEDNGSPGEKEVVECFEADTGKPLWNYSYPTSYIDPYGYNGGPRCTPLLTKERCYTFGAEGMLTCLDLEQGTKIWQRNTADEFKIPQAFFGVGSTPILEKGLLIVMVGGHPNSGVVAFDAKSGKTVWESVGPESFPAPPTRIQIDRPPAKLASYAAPLAATIHGKRHILCFMRPGLVSLDPKNGAINFSYWLRSTEHDSVNAARPVVAGDEIFLSAAYETGAALLKVHPDGKEYDVVWSDRGSREGKFARFKSRIAEITAMDSKTDEERQTLMRQEAEKQEYGDAMQTHWSTTIHHDGYLYGFSGRHEPGSTFRCIERETGKLMWATEDVNANDEPDPKAGLGATEPKFYGRGSAIVAEGKFVVQAERGTLALVELNPRKFVEISRVKYPEAGYPSWVAPVLSRQRLYLNVAREVFGPLGQRTHEYHLLCLDLAKK